MECAPGKTSPGNVDTCSKCPAGTYSGSGFKACEGCDIGRYSGEDGQSSCALCAVGTFSPSLGASVCAGCPAGRYQQASGQSDCSDCAEGTYTNEVGQAYCTQCNPGYWSYPGALSCTVCGERYFLTTKKHEGDPAVCKACPEFATCDGIMMLPVPDPGYWTDLRTGVRDQMVGLPVGCVPSLAAVLA